MELLELPPKKKLRASLLFFTNIPSFPLFFLILPLLFPLFSVFFFLLPPVFGPSFGFYNQRMHVFFVIIKTFGTLITGVMVTVSDDNSMQRDSSRETFPITKAIYCFCC